MTISEKKFAIEILGNAAPLHTQIFKNFTDAGSLSVPIGVILIQKDIYSASMSTTAQLANLTHELFHQVQYADSPFPYIKIFANTINDELTISLTLKAGAFPQLIGEFLVDEYMGRLHGKQNYVYGYGDLEQYRILSDLPFLESQAEMVGDFAAYYHQERYGVGLGTKNKQKMRQMAEILQNSGFESEAIQWTLENY